ncbi:MAG: type II toxin-antitoxin system prevent-host-death family antitoxin [Deltaproteobacteria bacterium]|nr:type II toxin-antitoxin system prevent-host-death family antitoxin [Deltaproteobacteria bacterium]
MPPQRSIQISEFKARCIESLHDVDRTRRPLIVTSRGRPIAVVEPIARERTLGSLEAECVIHGDLVAQDFDAEWEMNR